MFLVSRRYLWTFSQLVLVQQQLWQWEEQHPQASVPLKRTVSQKSPQPDYQNPTHQPKTQQNHKHPHHCNSQGQSPKHQQQTKDPARPKRRVHKLSASIYIRFELHSFAKPGTLKRKAHKQCKTAPASRNLTEDVLRALAAHPAQVCRISPCDRETVATGLELTPD